MTSNLQPLYDVKERLEAAAVAGVGLLEEDFRLRRAAEAIRPLASASPVFGKISAGLDKLLSAPAGNRAGLLLDTLALVDAVAYTQGRTGLDGELSPLPLGRGTCQQIPYSALQPLTASGPGRAAAFQTARENHREYLTDFRILPRLIDGLGDGAAGDQCAEILRELGPWVVPLLKEDFDPKGKRAMARRVEIIDAVAGAEEQDWYLSQMEEANKDVRAPLIYALRHREENFPRLRELCKTEKGACQERAIWAVVCLKSPEAAAYTRTLAGEKPGVVLRALEKSGNPAHGDLIAEMTGGQLDKIFGSEKPNWSTPVWEDMERLLRAAIGKDSPGMLELYRQMAAWYAGDRSRWRTNGLVFQNRRNIVLLAPFLGRGGKGPLPAGLLSASVWRNPSPALKALAEELARTYGWSYLQPLVIAAGLTESPEALWEKYSPLLKGDVCTRNQRLGILAGLGCLTGRKRGLPVLDKRWARTLTELPLVPIGDEVPLWRASGYKNNTWVYTAAPLELALCALDPSDGDCAGAFRENLEKMDRQPGVSVGYMMESLRYRGWRDWKGMLPALVLASGERISPLDLEQWYREYIGNAMSGEEKARELEWFREGVRAKRFKVFVTWSEERVQGLIDSLRK